MKGRILSGITTNYVENNYEVVLQEKLSENSIVFF